MVENLKCPDCAGPMAPRTNSKTGQKFWGCLRFPKCKGTRDTDGLSAAERYHQRQEEGDHSDATRTRPSWKQLRRWER